MIVFQTANIVPAFDLFQCTTSGLIPFQFHDHCRVMVSGSRYKYQIRKAFSALQFPINRIAVLCRIVCQTQYTSQRIFIVVLNHRAVVAVNFLKHFRNLFRILCQCQLQQLIGTMNGIDLSLYEKRIFDSYNDFFTRKIRVEERPVNPDANALVSPSDGKVSVYKIHENGHFLIKHTEYTLEQLLQDKKLAKRYLDGHIYVIRLTVDDYHRYCYAADGRKSEQRKIAGILHTVNPVANDVCPIYKMNSREYCLIKTEQFGTLLQMEVGALMVGKISNNQQGLGFVHKGVEKGRFEFGGSTIILLTQKNVVIPDRDLLEHTGSGMETLVKMGEQIGRSANRLDA